MRNKLHFPSLIALALAALLALWLPAALAEEDPETRPIRVLLDGVELDVTEGRIVDGRLYVDLADLAAALDGRLSWTAGSGEPDAEGEADDLTGRWERGDQAGTYLIFDPDGTGLFGTESGDAEPFKITWTRDGERVTYTYARSGTFVSSTYVLTEADGEAVLEYAENPERRYFRAEAVAEALADPSGEWRCRLADATATLTLNEDGSARLQVGAQAYLITWKLEGETILLDQNGAVISAEYDGETIVMTLGAQRLVFTK